MPLYTQMKVKQRKIIIKSLVFNRNSLDDPVYLRMERGELQYLSADPAARTSTAKLVVHDLLNPTITKSR
jgi:hypothetical protein